MNKLKIAYFGTPDFSVPALDMLYNHPDVELAYVISMPDRKAGRGYSLKSPEVIEYAKEKKIAYFQTENINKEEEFLNQIKSENIDCFIVLAFAQFLSSKVLEIPKLGSFNIHTSLLPKYRGAAPIQYALLNGDTSTGVSIQKMVKKMDAGDLCHSSEVLIADNETGGQLYTRLKYRAALSLNELIYKLKSRSVVFVTQDESKVSFAPTLKREDGHIKFSTQSFKEIFNRSRALFPWPGTFCFLNDKRLKLHKISRSDKNVIPGEVFIEGNKFIVGCMDGSVSLDYIQLEGKKPCSANQLINGLREKELKIS